MWLNKMKITTEIQSFKPLQFGGQFICKYIGQIVLKLHLLLTINNMISCLIKMQQNFVC